ncbi:LysR substrate-binding domain-containing protein [Cupriavidus sp. P-10]|uniref:LysR substrate-binding domain-containing protein n=2 Tax=Burkholderiaceae TaxID=119060 RepID=UPI0009BCCF12
MLSSEQRFLTSAPSTEESILRTWINILMGEILSGARLACDGRQVDAASYRPRSHYLIFVASVLPAAISRRHEPPRPSSDVPALPLIAYDEDLPLIRPIWAAMFQFAPTLQAALTIPDLRIIQDLVVKGQGWSVLPDYQCTEALASGRLVSVTRAKDAPTNNLYLVWNKASMRNPRIVHARDFILGLFSRKT